MHKRGHGCSQKEGNNYLLPCPNALIYKEDILYTTNTTTASLAPNMQSIGNTGQIDQNSYIDLCMSLAWLVPEDEVNPELKKVLRNSGTRDNI